MFGSASLQSTGPHSPPSTKKSSPSPSVQLKQSGSSPSTKVSQSLSSSSLQSSGTGSPGAQLSTHAPPVHESSPVEAHAPTPQVVGVVPRSSSVDPSQSLSRLSQISSAGSPGAQLSTQAPPIHASSPVEAHSPAPQAVGVVPRPSSVDPSQSLSRLSQISSAGSPGAQLSTQAPPIHASSPVEAHSPVPQAVAVVPRPSSVEPSQSLSAPSQTSSAPG